MRAALLVAVLLSLVVAAAPSPVPQKRVEARPGGYTSVTTDGGAYAVSCLAAGLGDGGCLTNGIQSLAGDKTWEGAHVFQRGVDIQGNANFYSTIRLVAAASTIQSFTTGAGISFISNRLAGDPGADFVLAGPPGVQRTGGSLLQCINNGETTGSNDWMGNWNTGGVANPDGGPRIYGSFIDTSGNSGNESLTCSEGLYTVVAGRLDGNPAASRGWDAGNPDGGSCPTVADGGTGGLCLVNYYYGGYHGDVTLASHWPRHAGLGVSYSNNINGSSTALRWFVDYNGGMAQGHGLSVSQFGAPLSVVITSNGQQFFGQYPSTLMYSFGNSTADKAWYFESGVDVGDGGHWRPVGGRAGVIVLSGGVGTAVVNASSGCNCTDQSSPKAVQCALSGTTLTATVTSGGTDSVWYSCTEAK